MNIENSDSLEKEFSNSSSNESDPIREAKQLGANLSEPENAAIARKRKIQRKIAGRTRCKRGKKDLHVRVHGREFKSTKRNT